jgi:2-dehydropantoate 2-reductase
MKYGVIGTGAVGGYYGGLLAHHELDVHFLLHSDYFHVKNNGLIVESKDEDFILPEVNAYSQAKDMPVCDVTIVALKTTQNSQLSGMLPHVVKDNGIVIMLQNGLGMEKDVANIVPNATVLGGACFLGSNKVGPGHIKHIAYGSITLGEYALGYRPVGITKHLELLSNEFKRAGIAVQLASNLGEAWWRKLVWNVPFNGLSVVLNSTTHQPIDHPATHRLAQDMMMEVITAATKCGYPIEEKYANKVLELTKQLASYKPSMKVDFESGWPLEIETIYRRPISEAESVGYVMKAVQTLALQLEYLDRKWKL